MALFRYATGKEPYYIEAGWPRGSTYKKSPTTIRVTKKDEQGKYVMVQDLGEVNYEKEKAEHGWHFSAEQLGDIELKIVKRALLFTEVQVFLNGEKLKGSEILSTAAGEVGRYS